MVAQKEIKNRINCFYRSLDHRIIYVERDLRRTSSSTSCSKQGLLRGRTRLLRALIGPFAFRMSIEEFIFFNVLKQKDVHLVKKKL